VVLPLARGVGWGHVWMVFLIQVSPQGAKRTVNDESKTKKPSLAELVRLRRRIDELETTNAELRDDREALQEGEGFLARVLNSSPFPFFIVNPDTSIRYAGLALEKLTGFTPEEVIGIKAPYPWWPKDAEKDMKEYLGQAMRHGLYRREIWLQKKDGGPCCVEVSSFPVKERGRLKYYFSAWMDVTERRQTEEAIKRRLDFERTIALASSRLVTITDMEEAINCALADIGEFSGASRAYIFLLCDGGKFMGNTHEWCAQGVSPQKDNLQNLSCAGFPWWMQKLRSNETIRITNVAEMPDEAGAEREIMKSQDIKSLLVLPLWAQDELSGFIGFDSVTRTGEWREEDLAMLRIASDVIGSALRRQQMEAALKESEQKYRLLVENQTDLIVEIDGDWNITFVSPSCCEFFGKEEAELLGKQFLPLVYEEDQEVTARALESLYEPPYTYYVEQQALTKNRRRWLAWAGKAILDEDSKVIAIVCVGRDITEQ